MNLVNVLFLTHIIQPLKNGSEMVAITALIFPYLFHPIMFG